MRVSKVIWTKSSARNETELLKSKMILEAKRHLQSYFTRQPTFSKLDFAPTSFCAGSSSCVFMASVPLCFLSYQSLVLQLHPETSSSSGISHCYEYNRQKPVGESPLVCTCSGSRVLAPSLNPPLVSWLPVVSLGALYLSPV